MILNMGIRNFIDKKMESNHTCKIEVFITKYENKCQFRCSDCNKLFKYTDALVYIDNTLGLDEWRRLRHIQERFELDKNKFKKISKSFVFSNETEDEYIKIS